MLQAVQDVYWDGIYVAKTHNIQTFVKDYMKSEFFYTPVVSPPFPSCQTFFFSFSRSGYYCSSQTHMDDDGCIRRRMFVLLQSLPYQVMTANSLKQMETRRRVWLPEEEWGTQKHKFNSERRQALERWTVFFLRGRGCNPQQGKGEAGVRTEARPRDVLLG